MTLMHHIASISFISRLSPFPFFAFAIAIQNANCTCAPDTPHSTVQDSHPSAMQMLLDYIPIAHSKDQPSEAFRQQVISTLNKAVAPAYKLRPQHECFLALKQLPPNNATVSLRSRIENTFGAMHGGRLTSVTNSILFIGGVCNITSVDKSVLLVHGAVSIGHCSRSVVIASHYVSIAHDGTFPSQQQGSLIASGDTIHISHARGTICDPMRRLRIGFANEVLCFNPNASVSFSHENSCERSLTPVSPPVASQRLPLIDGVSVRQILYDESNARGSFLVLQRSARELLFRIGDSPSLLELIAISNARTCTLVMIQQDYALLSIDGKLYGLVE